MQARVWDAGPEAEGGGTRSDWLGNKTTIRYMRHQGRARARRPGQARPRARDGRGGAAGRPSRQEARRPGGVPPWGRVESAARDGPRLMS